MGMADEGVMPESPDLLAPLKALIDRHRRCFCGVDRALDAALGPLATQIMALQLENERLKAQIEAAWFGIEHGYDIEDRAIIEREAKTNGFRFGLAQAIHTIWKREPTVERIEAERDALQSRLTAVEQENERLRQAVEVFRAWVHDTKERSLLAERDLKAALPDPPEAAK